MAKSEQPPKRAFIKALERIAYRHSITQVFDDFLEMSICAFAMGTMEETYHRIISGYSKDELPLFAECLAHMMNEYQIAARDGGWDDMLGIFFEEIGSLRGKQALGQFFTPKTVCDLMAQITGDKSSAVPDGTTVSDPAAGSGRNLIAHSRLHPGNRWNTFYHAYDVDRRCVNMSVINMLMYGMKGVAIHMNSISLEVYSGFRVYLPEVGLGVRKLSQAECWYYIKEQKIREEDQAEPKPVLKENIQVANLKPTPPIIITPPKHKAVQGSLF